MAPARPAFLPRHARTAAAALDDGGAISAADLAARGRAMAARLEHAQAILCLCASRVHVATSLLAGLLLERPCVMPHDHSRETLRRLRRRYPGANAVAEARRAPALDADAVEPLAAPGASGTSGPLPPGFPEQRCAAHVFTSGSTGEPGVHHKPWGALVASGTELGGRLGIAAGHCVVATVPGQHVYGLEASIMLPLMSGGIISAGQPLLPADIAAALGRAPSPRALVSTPVQLRRLVDADGLALPPVEHVISATAPLDEALADRVEQCLQAPVVEMYGSTETGLVATRRTVAGETWEPIAGVALEPDGPGCVVTARHLPRAIRLGDRIEPQGAGRFRLAGRSEDLVKVGGKRGSLDDIAGKLLAAPGVQDAAVFVPQGRVATVRRPAAFVVAPGTSAGAILDYLRARLDPVFLPRPLVHVDALPRASTGKLARAELERLYRERVTGGGEP